jgi:predicted RNA-binding protein with PIN domain
VERCCAWAAANAVRVLVVFDGGEPAERAIDDRCTVAGSGAGTADEWLERRAADLQATGRRYWLVTSDRALRAAAGREAERTIGGGAFLRELTSGRTGP